jgi:hypothetical protein
MAKVDHGYDGTERYFVVNPGDEPIRGRIVYVCNDDCTAGFVTGDMNYWGIPWGQIFAPRGKYYVPQEAR